ncbi:MAG: hypothetical protein M3Z56_01990 [Bacteroidota bacterium]|nr:hypothetical protein [Bacteroidota bacterium]
MKKFWFKKGLMFAVLFIAAIVLFSAIVMALWNGILPAVLGVKPVSFLQALGILVLSKILFGGFGRRGGWRGGRGNQWRRNMQQKWADMTPEEREKFKAEWKNRCGSSWERKEQNATENYTAE